ncbi:hypothetical protein EJ08DRAFT_498464 [Tothia fuscella]|uniref:Uncharacterized protein n=1 Tax=Tothia fuscella TaxID=1048955 RepID=A0A9P4U2T2_9PEZI|nr:hypothetical protein EJ08DRAFT_498464 [Tothia fuscella]
MDEFHGHPPRKFKIFRKAGDSTSLDFDPPLKSDALFDALREAYPEEATHQQRHRRAVLEFFQSELSYESQGGPSASSGTESGYWSGSNSDSANQQSAGLSTINPIRLPSTNRATTYSRSKLAADSDHNKMQSMRVDFALPQNGKKQSPRAPMDDRRREEYRITKERGACEKHRKQKKRCNCNLPTPKQKQKQVEPIVVSNMTTSTSSSNSPETDVFVSGQSSEHSTQPPDSTQIVSTLSFDMMDDKFDINMIQPDSDTFSAFQVPNEPISRHWGHFSSLMMMLLYTALSTHPVWANIPHLVQSLRIRCRPSTMTLNPIGT